VKANVRASPSGVGSETSVFMAILPDQFPQDSTTDFTDFTDNQDRAQRSKSIPLSPCNP
jgi:hypothetical protein